MRVAHSQAGERKTGRRVPKSLCVDPQPNRKQLTAFFPKTDFEFLIAPEPEIAETRCNAVSTHPKPHKNSLEAVDRSAAVSRVDHVSAWLRQAGDWMSRRSTSANLILAGTALLLIGCFDYFTGIQVNSSLFYVLPVLYVARYARRSLGLMAAVAATVVWLIAETLPPAAYAHPLVPVWNAFMRLGVLLVVVWLVSAMRTLNETLERRVQDRTERLQSEIRERRELERRILEISEREQARIGQDLHDGLCQQLVSTAFAANSLCRQLSTTAPTEAANAAKIATLLDESITQARHLARGLYPIRLEEEGLATVLQELAEHFEAHFGVRCQLQFTDTGQSPDPSVAIHLYRIAQEAISNAIKHGRPREIHVHLRCAPTAWELKISDDGLGVDHARRRADGIGLRIMEYRARMIGGTFGVHPRPGGGTIVHVVSAMPTAPD